MPCHDILVQTSITEANQEAVSEAQPFWLATANAQGITIPLSFGATVGGRVSYDDTNSRTLSLMGLAGLPVATQDTIKERYEQSFVAGQLFRALQEDGYEMSAVFSPEHEGTWVIEAKDISRNATIGVTLYRTLDFEIDFLDAMHDDSVWLSGGEFGRILEYLRRLGMSVDVLKQDINQEIKQSVSSKLYS